MSAGLMSCVRENSPPITTMENSGAASLSSESQADNQKRRRRFHPLRNLRRIFRRRTLAHADTIRPIVQQHHHHHHYHHHNNSGNGGANNQQQSNDSNNLSSTVSTIRSLSSQSIDDDDLPSESTSAHDFQTSRYLIRPPNHSSTLLLPSTKRAAFFNSKENNNRRAAGSGGGCIESHSKQYYMDGSGCTAAGGEASNGNNGDSDLQREMTDYQRSLSEGRLVDNDFSRDTLSHSHDSVFSESATASSLSIVLKAELADALRKRKSRSDASDEDLGLPRSPSTPPRNAAHHVVDGQSNSTNSTSGRHHHSSLGLLSMASSEIYDDSMGSQGFLTSNSKSSYDIGKYDGSDEIFPDMSFNSSGDSEMKLSHSAAKHKMAIRPKKKGPSRPSRKAVEITLALPSTPEVNEDFFKSSTIDSHVSKSQSLPRGIHTKSLEKQSIIISTSGKHSKNKTSEKSLTANKSLSKSYNFDDKQKDEPKTSTSKNAVTSIVITASPSSSETREERTHSEEGFFRRFINRSGRKHKKEREKSADKDTIDAKKIAVHIPESAVPAIKKSPDLSIIDVLSRARANEIPIDSKALLNTYLLVDELDKNSKFTAPRSDKPRSGPAARQRILPKDVTQSADLLPAEIVKKNKKQQSDPLPIKTSSPRTTSPHASRQEFATSFLRFSPPKSYNQADAMIARNNSPDNSYTRTTQYRSEEILNTNENRSDAARLGDDTPTPYSVSLPKSVWPNESKFMQNSTRSSCGWSQCQQKISKLSSDQQTDSKSPTKGKMVEKSKSFRLYTKNYNDAAIHSSNEFKSFVGNMPSLPDLNSSGSNSASLNSRYSSNRDSLQSLRFMNIRSSANSNTKWSPTRSSSSSRVSDHAFANNKFEINDFSLVPKPIATLSTSITSDEVASFGLDKNVGVGGSESGNQNVLVTSSKTQNHSSHLVHNPNINEIEDNIDKIMKSSVITVLKKSPTADLYQIKNNNTNVSLTTITNSKDDDANTKVLNIACVENPPLLRHSMTASKLDIQLPLSPLKKVGNVPEFMQIQLNRVDATRPKSYIEYSSGTSVAMVTATTPTTPNDDDKERRFSNESIEISDKKKVAINTSPIHIFGSSQTLNKSTESLKSAFSRHSRASISSQQQLSRGSSISDINKGSVANDNQSSDDCIDNLSDDESDVNSAVIVERRKSVSDKKLKFEKKIEEIQAEVKRSSIIGIDKGVSSASRKSSIEDENNPIILRSKKSLSSLASKSSDDSDDPTPELMKVFARRSLKIKDTDDYLGHADAELDSPNRKFNVIDGGNSNNINDNDNNNNVNNVNSSKINGKINADSDKENQVSGASHSPQTPQTIMDNKSATNNIPKVEIHIKSPGDYDIREKSEIFRKDNKTDTEHTSVTNRNKSLITGKIFAGSAANRFTNSTSVTTNNYRNSSAFFENLNSANNILRCGGVGTTDQTQSQNSGIVLFIDSENAKNLSVTNNNEHNTTGSILVNNNNHLIKPTTATTIATKVGNLSVNSNRHSIASVPIDDVLSMESNAANGNQPSKISNNDQEIEFKGILERKAEWEKRANQAFK